MKASDVKAKRFVTLALCAGLLVIVCVGVSYFVTGLMVESDRSWRHDQEHGHSWLHGELNLTAAEIEAVDALEPAYRRDREKLLSDFDDRIAQLRRLLVTQDSFSPEVSDAIGGLHSVHGALQELSIRHYYDMMGALPSEKREKLRTIAVEALSEPE